MKSMIQNLMKKKEGGDLILNQNFLNNCSRTELNQLIIELGGERKEYKEAISRLGKVTDELDLYKTHSEELELSIKSMMGEIEDSKTLLDSRNHEVKILREKNKELEDQIGMISTSGDVSGILDQLNTTKTQLLEEQQVKMEVYEEKGRLEEQLRSLEEEIRVSAISNEELKEKTKELEEGLKKSKQEVKEVQRSKTHLTEKMEDLEADIRGKALRISELEMETAKIDTKSLVSSLEDTIRSLESENFELKKSKNELQAENESLSEQMSQNTREIELFRNKAEDTQSLENQISYLNEELISMQNSKSDLEEQLSNSQTALEDLRSNLKNLEEKHQTAKAELIKITEKASKIEPTPVEAPELKISLRGLPESNEENKALQIIKTQINILYKGLTELMMGAKTFRSGEGTIFFELAANSFEMFEKDFNKIMMNIHDAADKPIMLSAPSKSWGEKFHNFVKIEPSKLFSCMTKEDVPETTVIERLVETGRVESSDDEVEPIENK